MSRRTFLFWIALFAVLYGLLAVLQPDGGWDAWAIWNVRARFLAFADDITIVFDPTLHYPHPDYPPLLPAIIALGWRLFGDSRLVPIIFHGVIYLAALGLLRDRPWWVIVVVGTAGFAYAPSQTADMPLAAALLAAAWAYTHQRPTWAGIALGVGLLLKNEGALIALAFLAGWIVVERRIPWRAVVSVLPFAALLIAFRLWVAVPTDIFAKPGMLDRALDPTRYAIIGLATLHTLIAFGHSALLILAACMWLAAIRPAWNVPVAAVLLVFCGYLAIYLITPLDLVWHLRTSYDRLLWQLFPTFVYGITQKPHSIAIR